MGEDGYERVGLVVRWSKDSAGLANSQAVQGSSFNSNGLMDPFRCRKLLASPSFTQSQLAGWGIENPDLPVVPPYLLFLPCRPNWLP